MRKFNQDSIVTDRDTEITLGLLNTIDEDTTMTQRSVSEQLGIALGLTNTYLKRCIHMGLVKVKHAPANRYAYYLTPHGFAEKSRLTAKYLSYSLDFFRSARGQCTQLLEQCAENGWRRVALAGASDLAEIASLCAVNSPIELVGIVDESAPAEELVGLPLARRLKDLGVVDAIIITDYRNAQQTFDRLIEVMASDRVLAPSMLHVSRSRANLLED